MAEFKKAIPKSYKDEMKSENNKKMYPKIDLPIALVPQAKDWKIGGTYIVALKVKMTGITMNEYRDESTYDVLGAKVVSKKHNSHGKKRVKRY